MDDDDDVELFMLDDMQSSGIEVLIIDELEIIELSMDELVGQAIEELDVELSIMLDEDASAAKPGTTWAAIPPDASSRATMARYFFNFISSWLNVASTSTQRERSHGKIKFDRASGRPPLWMTRSNEKCVLSGENSQVSCSRRFRQDLLEAGPRRGTPVYAD